MTIKIKMCPTLRHLANNQDRVEVNGVTVHECIDDLAREFPATGKWLFDKHGNLLVLVLVNNEVVDQKNLNMPLADGDELGLSLIVGGG